MKKLFVLIMAFGALSAYAKSETLLECQFGSFGKDFTPNSFFTATLKNEANNEVVYKVEHLPVGTGPSEFAVLQNISKKTRVITFFDYDMEDGIQRMNHSIMLGKKISRDRIEGTITYAANFRNYNSRGMMVTDEGTCTLKK